MIPGNPVKSIGLMRWVYSRKNAKTKQWTKQSGRWLQRLIQLMNAWIIRRPASLTKLPPLERTQWTFSLNANEERESNYHYGKYITAINIHSNDKGPGDGNNKMTPPRGHLAKASQHSYHPRLAEIMAKLKITTRKQGIDNAVEYEVTPEQAKALSKCLKEIKKNNNWMSSRIMAKIEAFDFFRQKDPSTNLLIIAESVFYLEIVAVAFDEW
ncbi:hypothetical protein GLAREA_07286 [Glarea lozoyensis ATCC 20868]|uniref:Uncharacterized protein n=1 Tax=Glarea lozoyensis (strain ATCC 20868 / MF5171) TaxID=1116229 RepID=S3E0V5_GLAL2|nr:uncharacterized protein GLAREA_07286 [Glarea lozoyensis ATCC 20868]EPE32153.1 hypothetical protein GLAREA_07286 [Glarea lozoyensis ATCC 20868]